jgi:hypothetical protein
MSKMPKGAKESVKIAKGGGKGGRPSPMADVASKNPLAYGAK